MAREHSWPDDVPKVIRRNCFTGNGLSKKRLTKKEAEFYAHKNKRRAYLCIICGWWHTGNLK